MPPKTPPKQVKEDLQAGLQALTAVYTRVRMPPVIPDKTDDRYSTPDKSKCSGRRRCTGSTTAIWARTSERRQCSHAPRLASPALTHSTHPRPRRCETLSSMLKARYALNPTKKQAAHGLHGVMEQTATLLADNATRKWAFNAHARGI